jgi:uncharacterized Zn finger protein
MGQLSVSVFHCANCFRFVEVNSSELKNREDSVVTVACQHCGQVRDYSLACFFEISFSG